MDGKLYANAVSLRSSSEHYRTSNNQIKLVVQAVDGLMLTFLAISAIVFAFPDLEEKCVLFKRCKTWKRAEGWGFAGRVSRRTKYYKPPRGFYCSNCDRVGMTSASSTFKKCLKRCDNTSGCKQVEWNSANYQCTLWSSGLTMYTASMDYVTAKKKRRTR